MANLDWSQCPATESVPGKLFDLHTERITAPTPGSYAQMAIPFQVELRC